MESPESIVEEFVVGVWGVVVGVGCVEGSMTGRGGGHNNHGHYDYVHIY